MLMVVGLFFILSGLFFSIVGVIGIYRLPDALSRLHASGKVSVLGLLGLLIGGGFLVPENALKFLLLGLFVLLASPVVSHAIALSRTEPRSFMQDSIL
jgi:multicomponent Na+:H+ antiporter subunit G